MEDNLKYWLALSRIKGVERLSVMNAITGLGGVDSLFTDGFRIVEKYSPELAAGIKSFKDWDWVQDEIGRINANAEVVGIADKAFPALLKEIFDPPPMLYVKGKALAAFDAPCIAIVGTRRPSHYGLRMAERIASELAGAGVTVVSGMARGCDSAAHKGALAAGGVTVAVLGTGIDVAYPPENKKLSDEVAEKGLLVSEYPMGTPPMPYNFPRRNRIIGGLVTGILVVEAPLRSGALQTARLALEYGRDVFAIPGAVSSPKSAGTNKLIKDGAGLVETADDILSALNIVRSRVEDEAPLPELGSVEGLIWGALSIDEPRHIDDIAVKTGLGVAKASAFLLDMELKGLVKQRQGMCFLKAF